MAYGDILIFWVIIQIFGLVGLPFAFRLFQNLPDKGYAFAKPLGILLCGYVLWLLGSFGLLRNNLGGTILAIALVSGLGTVWYFRQAGPRLGPWLKANRAYVVTVELIFAVAFVLGTLYKAHNPNIETSGGEKWMEIAFINASLLSPSFPPQDPWLAGFGISYYYFGYVLMAILIRLSGIVSTTAFNLLIPMLFGFTLIGAFGLVAGLVTVQQQAESPSPTARLYGCLGGLFVAILGHLEGFLEVLHSRGLLSPGFWAWLDIIDLKEPPQPGPWLPDRWIWWWRGSRVLSDYTLAGQQLELIDEMPIFSFLLGDVHPHVLALPFVLLAIALAFNLILSPKAAQEDASQMEAGEVNEAAGWLAQALDLASRSLKALVQAMGGRSSFWLYALLIGSLGFLNTWDFPIYLAVLGLTYLAWRGRQPFRESLVGLAFFAVAGVGLYLPFYVGFQSQAGGILPNLWSPTRLPQFFVFFGPFLLGAIGFLLALSRRNIWPWRTNLRWTLPLAILGPVAFLILLIIAFVIMPGGRGFVDGILRDPAVQAAINGAGLNNLLLAIIQRRGGNPWTFLLLGGLLGWSLAHFWTAIQPTTGPDEAKSTAMFGRAEKFVLILLMMGLLLPLAVEFIFLRDNFGYRLNTIFKFYFQAWVLLALASAFAVYYLSQALAGLSRAIWQGAIAVLVVLGLVYPVLMVWTRANGFSGQPTLNGIAWVEQIHPDDYAAILWLRQHAPADAVILESPTEGGDAYRYEGRISALTGRPTLLGWGGHEHQWRGNFDEPNRRHPDIDLLYNGLDPLATLTLLDKYDITYVYVGAIERKKYTPSGLAKFEALLDVAFRQGDVVIYQRAVQKAQPLS